MKKEETIVREGRAYGANGANGARANGADRAYGLIMGLIGLMGLMGCSKDDYEEQSGAPLGTIIPEVASYVTWFEEADKTSGANGASGDHGSSGITRAWTVPTGYVVYENGIQPIGIAFTRDGVDPAEGEGESPKTMIGNFFYTGSKWRTSLEDIKATDYYLYGYIPYLPSIGYNITDNDPETGGANDKYSEGAIMTLQNVPTVMPNDLCVVIGAKHGDDREHDGGLRQGDFSFIAKQGTDSKDYVFLLFDHLYAALRVRMKVHSDYSKLRTIKLKSLQLSTQADNETTKKRTDITIKLRATDGSVSPIQEITYGQPETPYPAIEGGLEFWSSTNGEELTNDFKPFIGHFMPNGITRLSLTSVYDVYDKKKNLIRKDCKVTNSVSLSALFSGQTQTERGKRYTISMTIQPTYIYMLSEPDLDNPTVVVN